VLVIRGGRIVGEFAGTAMTEENILTAAFADPNTSEDA
jgi:simple sugar transport system ATP-binding protein/ribose transport system ATP-binding protein